MTPTRSPQATHAQEPRPGLKKETNGCGAGFGLRIPHRRAACTPHRPALQPERTTVGNCGQRQAATFTKQSPDSYRPGTNPLQIKGAAAHLGSATWSVSDGAVRTTRRKGPNAPRQTTVAGGLRTTFFCWRTTIWVATRAVRACVPRCGHPRSLVCAASKTKCAFCHQPRYRRDWLVGEEEEAVALEQPVRARGQCLQKTVLQKCKLRWRNLSVRLRPPLIILDDLGPTETAKVVKKWFQVAEYEAQVLPSFTPTQAAPRGAKYHAMVCSRPPAPGGL